VELLRGQQRRDGQWQPANLPGPERIVDVDDLGGRNSGRISRGRKPGRLVRRAGVTTEHVIRRHLADPVKLDSANNLTIPAGAVFLDWQQVRLDKLNFERREPRHVVKSPRPEADQNFAVIRDMQHGQPLGAVKPHIGARDSDRLPLLPQLPRPIVPLRIAGHRRRAETIPNQTIDPAVHHLTDVRKIQVGVPAAGSDLNQTGGNVEVSITFRPRPKLIRAGRFRSVDTALLDRAGSLLASHCFRATAKNRPACPDPIPQLFSHRQNLPSAGKKRAKLHNITNFFTALGIARPRPAAAICLCPHL